MAVKYGDTSKGYGTASYSGASSDNPNQRTRAPLTVNNDDGDAVLAAVRANGAKGSDSPDVFNARGNVKAAPAVAAGCKPSTPADTPKVPGPGRQPTTR